MPDISSLDLNLLRTLDALLDERSVTRAASRLALTQPAVSGMLTRLRHGFGDPLFVRARRGLVPTARALELAAPVKLVLGEINALLRPASFDPATAAFTLSIAATDYALSAIVVPFLATLRREAPNVRVAVKPVDGAHLPDRLERSEVDVALVTPETVPAGCRQERLFDETYACALRQGHPACDDGALTLDRFCALDHALMSLSGSFAGVTDDALARIGRSRRVALSVASFLVLPAILRTGDLIAVVPRRLVAGVEGITIVEPPLAIPGFTKVMTWHERSHHDVGRAWARALLARSTPP